MQWKHLLSDVDLGEAEAAAVADVVRSKWLSLGPRTAEFERQFADFLGVRHAVAVANCTAALHLALAAVGVEAGDEVLTPSYTFVATANAILYQRATPVFVDIVGPADLNLDPDDLARKITPRTKAICVVHLAGYPADMDRIMALAERHHLAVVEDACHAIGAAYLRDNASCHHGKMAGAIGDVGCFSFFANKNLVTGEGGMLVTNDDRIAQCVRTARSHGMTKSSWDKASGRASDYDVVQLGYNYRCTEITAALGMVQLAKLQEANARRRQLAAAYHARLQNVAGVSLPFANQQGESAHHILPVVLDDPHARQHVRQSLADQGVQTSVHYPPVHQFSHYQSHVGDVSLPKTEDASARELTLPLHPLMHDS
ncbi:MAG: DegT/DnrJ/EryC1/StrS family aminotransferase, partial [Planctomycetales bacterium]|nr:DegT/DnrJ/EryC1/StrS family aminotransferase [Planctomycetales bacterium]